MESWVITPDKFIIHVRPGVYWTGKEGVMDRREFTADDVIFNIHRFSEIPKFVGSLWVEYEGEKGNGNVTDVYATDKYTVVLETAFYSARMTRYICGKQQSMYPHEVVEAGQSDWDNLVGTGPFMYDKYVEGSYMSYNRNPNYWRKATIDGVEYQLPFVDKLIFPLIIDPSTQLAALRTGKLDILYPMDLRYESTLAQTNPELLQFKYEAGGVRVIVLNMDREPFNNREVRRAMWIALDLQYMNEALYLDGNLHAWPIMPGVPGHKTYEELEPSIQELYSYDPAKAKQMIIDAGYPDGFKVTALCRDDPIFSDIEVMCKAYWEEIGVEMDIEVLEKVARKARLKARDTWEVTAEWANCNTPQEATHKWGPLEAPPQSTWNTANYRDPYVWEQWLKANAIADTDEANAIWVPLIPIVVNDAAYMSPGADSLASYWWPWVKNYYGEAYFYSIYSMTSAWIDQDLKAEMGY
ncbi:hypothetical protein ES703_100600 [subsurface metagenome]